ncbi:MAG: DUF4249 domain-containing protein [Bacteroidota bacterium]|nr:DUF4249 domain-containing protein [Bacteroidota bacterium]
MKKYIYISILLLSISFSCRKIYDPDIDSSQNALVVECQITNQAGPYTVHLTKAQAYDATNTSGISVRNAKVYITDNNSHTYNFTELGSGYYASNAADFTGIPGITYTLHIKTSDGNIYESSSQKMLSNDYADSVYAEYSSKETLVEDYDGETRKVTTDGVDLLTDIKNNTDTLPRFRFKSTIYSEWIFVLSLPMSPVSIYYYGWYTTYPDDNVNLTQEKYSTSSKSIEKHSICFVPTVKYCIADLPDTSATVPIINRIIKVLQYRVNDETFQYYKNINTLISAEGKIFDPVAMQLKGNITCTNDPSKIVLGFFEVSSLKIKTYSIRRGDKIVVKQPNIWPPTNSGFKQDTIPSFWVN